MVFPQALGKSGLSPLFPLNLRLLFQTLKFWNSLKEERGRRFRIQNPKTEKRQAPQILFPPSGQTLRVIVAWLISPNTA
jgi:hypothetical protein